MSRQMQACAEACPRARVHRGRTGRASKLQLEFWVLHERAAGIGLTTSIAARGDDVSQKQHTLPCVYGVS